MHFINLSFYFYSNLKIVDICLFMLLFNRSPMKLAMERQKQLYKAGWLTSPNTYTRSEIEEIGTTTPKKITKVGIYFLHWVFSGKLMEI